MRFAFALGLMALAMGIPLCAQQAPQDATEVRAALPPLVFLSESTATTLAAPHAKTFSSGFVVKLAPIVTPSETATTTLPDLHAKRFSSGFVVKLPDFTTAHTAPKP